MGLKLAKAFRNEYSETSKYQDGSGTVAVIVAGNDMEWDHDAWIWLPSDVAMALDEAWALKILPDETRTVDGTQIFVYELTRR